MNKALGLISIGVGLSSLVNFAMYAHEVQQQIPDQPKLYLALAVPNAVLSLACAYYATHPKPNEVTIAI